MEGDLGERVIKDTNFGTLSRTILQLVSHQVVQRDVAKEDKELIEHGLNLLLALVLFNPQVSAVV